MTVLDRVPVKAITASMPKVDWVKLLRAFVALIALPFMLVGWAAKAVVFAVLWIWSAIVTGWDLGPSARAPEAG